MPPACPQIHRQFRKPLVVFSPKNLLRHPLAKSPLTDFDDKPDDKGIVVRALRWACCVCGAGHAVPVLEGSQGGHNGRQGFATRGRLRSPGFLTALLQLLRGVCTLNKALCLCFLPTRACHCRACASSA